MTRQSHGINTLLGRLDAVRQTGSERWIARCPAHDDRSPSLSIREADDGTVLIRCWTGCGAADIVAAVGLSLRDLFPHRVDHYPSTRHRDRWPARDLLALLRREAHIVAVIASDMRDGAALNEADYERLGQAVVRIATVADEAARIEWRPSDEALAQVTRRVA